MRLICTYCKQHWNIPNNQLKPKTPICFDCKLKRGLVPYEELKNMNRCKYCKAVLVPLDEDGDICEPCALAIMERIGEGGPD